MKEKIKKISNFILNIIIYIIFGIVTVLFSLSIYIKTNFLNASFFQLLQSLLNSKGTSFVTLKEGIIVTFLITCLFIILMVIIPLIVKKNSHNNYEWIIKFKNRKIFKFCFPIKMTKVYFLLLTFVMLLVSFHNYKLDVFLKNRFTKTTIYEDYYVDPRTIEFDFGENKRNLIYIFGINGINICLYE